VSLWSTPVLAGRLVDSDGKPQTGVALCVDNGGRIERLVLDGEGAFTVTPRCAYVRVLAHLEESTAKHRGLAEGPWCVVVGDWRVEAPIAAGDLSIRRMPRLEVLVMDHRGHPVQFPYVLLQAEGGCISHSTNLTFWRADRSGRLVLPLPAGQTFFLGGCSGSGGTQVDFEMITLKEGDAVETLILTLPQSAIVVGKVVERGTGAPVANARVAVNPIGGWAVRTLILARMERFGCDLVEYRSDADGRFSIPNLRRGLVHTLYVVDPEGTRRSREVQYEPEANQQEEVVLFVDR
jgi:hypothetical protein